MNWVLISYFMACSQEKPVSEPDVTPAEPAEEPCETQVWHMDSDGDGYGDPFQAKESCTELEGHVRDNTDCDDTDADSFPGQMWYLDADGDSYGNSEVSIEACSQPVGHIRNSEDCNDMDSSVNPGSVWHIDADGDGYGDPELTVESCSAQAGDLPNGLDCDDTDPLISPGSVEVCDFIDNDCDGLIDNDDPNLDDYTEVPIFVDADLDGVGTDYLQMACASSGLGSTKTGDCDDTDPDVFPGNFELPDEIDQNCDGESFFPSPRIFFRELMMRKTDMVSVATSAPET